MIKIAAISDLHGCLPNIPECDLLLIAGDICPHFCSEFEPVGCENDVNGQAAWLASKFQDWCQIQRERAGAIFGCWGNHDFVGQKHKDIVNLELILTARIGTDKLFNYKGLNIWTTPWQLWYHNWAFNAPTNGNLGEEFLRERYEQIPDDIDIIVSHGPPFGYGDITRKGQRTGSKALIETIDKVKPKLVITGHLHESYGQYKHNNTKIINASLCNINYEPVNPILTIEI